MERSTVTTVELQLRPELVAALQAIAEKQGVPKEHVASEAIALWVEHYQHYGPAFSRRQANRPN